MKTYSDACGVARALDLIGDRWALLIVRELMLGPKRFGALADGLRAAGPDMVAKRLRELTDHGIVVRRSLGAPANVDVYALSPRGLALRPVLRELGRWGATTNLPPDHLGLTDDAFLLAFDAVFPGRDDTELIVEFRLPGGPANARVADGGIEVGWGAAAEPDLVLEGDPDALGSVLWNEADPDASGVRVIAGRALLDRFRALTTIR
ncbi:winged helix-turn-helix transcriptional regulator [Cryptosporangium phraense]|uniref:Helix-turn-helix transcriptional regulator n=1 Tax=Cryptosporangium phraense TaxID=2593070 RepID=A0A545AX17_9ACTN|nr:helix-turn-helix domain-containing protein [Cryptosporangium phraense]TQS45877.1 helix-turn-helix transcriptional regulator [Cryptosporangium phraense]